MKTAISIIIFLIVCAMIAGTEISFNPFRIRFHEWEKLVGYILSEDPTYITNFNNARSLICHLDRDELLQELVLHYLEVDKR